MYVSNAPTPHGSTHRSAYWPCIYSMTTGVKCCSTAARSERLTIHELLGLRGDGRLAISILTVPSSLSPVMECVFPFALGSTTTATSVASKPGPARARVAATFKLLGYADAAPRA